MDGLVALLLSGAGLFRWVFVESCVPDRSPEPPHFVRASTAINNIITSGKTKLFLFITVDFSEIAKKLCQPAVMILLS
jgi:hypothetical protein